MNKIPMVDLRGQYLRIKAEVDAAIDRVLTETSFIQGPQVKTFEAALGSYTGAPFVVTCGNGTDALQIAMMALNLRPGDEVILPVHTYVATAEVIALLGLTPVFADVNPGTFTINTGSVEALITSRTKAIVPVHLYGQCADMEAILAIARRYNLFVIEDTAQALGARFTFSDGTVAKAGTMGTVGTTSFFPSKNLGCFGDGGAIFTSDEALAGRMRMVANHGQKKKYHHDLVGINSRLDTLQAAILEVKLRHLPEYEHNRRRTAEYYDAALSGISGLTIPARDPRSTHVFHQYTLKTERRDELKAWLEERGVPTMIYYPVPLHFQEAYRAEGLGPGSFPVSEQLSRTVISIPIHTELDTATMDYICGSIREFYHG